MSMLGRWDLWYRRGVDEPAPYGDTATYDLAEEHLAGLDVEDWGCGKGWFRTVHHGGYLGVDGTCTPHADVVADLTGYRSQTPGLLLRHVLEHNTQWHAIWANAVQSFTRRLVLVLFTPMSQSDQAERIGFTPGLDVHDWSLPHDAILAPVAGMRTQWADFPTATQYGTERVYRIERP